MPCPRSRPRRARFCRAAAHIPPTDRRDVTMTGVWNWLITPPATDSVLDLFGIVYLIVFAAGFVVCAYASGPGAAQVARNTGQLQGILQWANIGLAVFGAGLFFFGVRALQIDPLSFGSPIWMVAMVLVLVMAAVR